MNTIRASVFNQTAKSLTYNLRTIVETSLVAIDNEEVEEEKEQANYKEEI